MAGKNDEYITIHEPHWDENGRCYWDGILIQPKEKNAVARLMLPPKMAIPVIFLPGVMGSNLMSKKEASNKPIWRGDSPAAVLSEWLSKTPSQRKKLLDPKKTKVDDRGKISEEIFSPKTDNGGLFPPRNERGWGEVLYFSYGKFLSVFQGALVSGWQNSKDKEKSILTELVGKHLNTEESNESLLTSEELKHFNSFLFPLHVFGYNWLEDNKSSAEKLVTYIEQVLRLYRSRHGHGLAVEKVILVTHSMGGLIARYASQVLGAESQILGIVHGVIPDLGSPSAYRRMKVGAAQEGPAGAVMGRTADKLMPVLARAPAPLQLLPSADYLDGGPWLTIEGEGEDGRDLKLPRQRNPFDEIYLNKELWWRLYEADIIDSEQVNIDNNWLEYFSLMKATVSPFITALNNQYHHNSYIFYGNKVISDGSLTWKKTTLTYPRDTHEWDKKKPNNYRELPLPFNRSRLLKLTSSATPGDGTVPVESLRTIRHFDGLKSALPTDVDHQSAYHVDSLADILNRPAVCFTLRALIKMVQEVPSCVK